MTDPSRPECSMPHPRIAGLWLDGDLDHTVAPLAEELIGVDDVVQRKRVRNERNEVKASVPHELHQLAHPLLATRAERRDDLLVRKARGKRLNGHRKLAGINAKAR